MSGVPTEEELLRMPAEELRALRDRLVETLCLCSKEARLMVFNHAKSLFPNYDLRWLWSALRLDS